MTSLVSLLIQIIITDPTNALPQILQNTNPAASSTALYNINDAQIFTSRSRSDIIWSCFATIFACTWVAVHPNVPAPTDSEWKVLRHRFKIMMYTLLVPELVLYWASKQWYAASQAAKKHEEKGWTTVHGFFIGMGGLLLSEEGNPPRTLDMEYLEDAVDLGTMEWPKISEEEILDKGNGDYFTKGIVVLQTGWFVLQCIARAVARLSLTELEVTTLAYAVLNGAMYFFWWNKPLDVGRGMVIYQKKSGNLEFVSARNSDDIYGQISVVNVSRTLGATCKTVDISQSSRRSTLKRSRSLSSLSSTKSIIMSDNHNTSDIFRRSDHMQDLTHLQAQRSSVLFETTARSESPSLVISSTTLPPTRPRHHFSKKTKKSHIECLSTLIYPFRLFINDCEEMKDSGSLSSNGMSPFYASVRLPLKHALSVLLFLLGTIFGAIHCIAWSFEFPSAVEKWMWKGAAMGILILPSLIAANYLLSNWLHSPPFLGLHFTQFNFTVSLSGLCLLAGRFLEATSSIRLSVLFGLYIVSRTILLILPLIELRSLPPSAFQSIDWTGFIPHI